MIYHNLYFFQLGLSPEYYSLQFSTMPYSVSYKLILFCFILPFILSSIIQHLPPNNMNPAFLCALCVNLLLVYNAKHLTNMRFLLFTPRPTHLKIITYFVPSILHQLLHWKNPEHNLRPTPSIILLGRLTILHFLESI